MAESKSKSGVDVDKLEADFEADPKNFVPLARAYLERSLSQQAVRVCKLGLKHDSKTTDGHLALAMAYYHSYDDRNAERALLQVLKTSPESAAAHRTLGEILLERRQEQKAVSELRSALELSPRDKHTRFLLQSINEVIPPRPALDGQPEIAWIPRRAVVSRDHPQPFWRTAAQVLFLAAIVVLGLVWYNHRVDIRLAVRAQLREANKLIPHDNFSDLLSAETSLAAALQLDDREEKASVRQAFVQSLLWQDHGQSDRKAQLERSLQWMEDEDLPNPERFGLKGLMLLDAGKAQEAEKYLTTVIENAIEKKDIFLNAMVFGVRGATRLKTGDIEGAREDSFRAARFSSDSPHYQAQLGEVYLREGSLEIAVGEFQKALRQNPSHLYSNVRMAYVLVQLGKRLDQAKKILDEYLDTSRHPDSLFSPPIKGALYLARAEYALATNNPGDAAGWLTKSLATYETNPEAHDLAGRLATLNRDAVKAATGFARALQLDPFLPRIYFDRSESLFSLGGGAEALEKLKEFERRLKPTVAYFVQTGNIYLRMDEFDKAMSEFEKAVKADELNPDAHLHVALCFQKMGAKLGDAKEKQEEKQALYNRARQAYEDTLILPGGERADVYHQMGLIYLDSDDFDNAMDKLAKSAIMMQQAGEPGSRIAEVYLDIARVFRSMGGPEGQKQERIYMAKAQGLREGKTAEEVDKEWNEKAAQEEKNIQPRFRHQPQ